MVSVASCNKLIQIDVGLGADLLRLIESNRITAWNSRRSKRLVQFSFNCFGVNLKRNMGNFGWIFLKVWQIWFGNAAVKFNNSANCGFSKKRNIQKFWMENRQCGIKYTLMQKLVWYEWWWQGCSLLGHIVLDIECWYALNLC